MATGQLKQQFAELSAESDALYILEHKVWEAAEELVRHGTQTEGVWGTLLYSYGRSLLGTIMGYYESQKEAERIAEIVRKNGGARVHRVVEGYA